jgi:hypothetical protein
MATLVLDQRDTALLTRAVRPPKGRQAVRVVGRLANGHWLVCSSRAGEPDHELIENPRGRIACNCTAGVHGARCTHAAILRAFLAWQAQQEGAGR